MKEKNIFNNIRETGICPDNYVGYIKIKNRKIEHDKSKLWFIKDKRILKSCLLNKFPDQKCKVITIVLESPHKDEFSDELTAPALGTTGSNLQKYFVNSLQQFLDKDLDENITCTYEVILMNAIQYQCSLGICTEIYRDFCWLKLWKCDCIIDDFKKRLNKYNPSIIINLCTKGSHKCDPNIVKGTKTMINHKYLKERIEMDDKIIANLEKQMTLQKFVDVEIKNYIRNRNILQINGTHPSSWTRNGKHRILTLSTS